MKKIHNDLERGNIKFIGFRGIRPSAVLFSVEQFEGGFFGPAGLVSVPLTARPKSISAEYRARDWARQRVLDALAREAA